MGLLQANNPLLIIIAGLMIGLIHAFEPDHLSAVSTQLFKNNNTTSGSSQRQGYRNSTFQKNSEPGAQDLPKSSRTLR